METEASNLLDDRNFSELEKIEVKELIESIYFFFEKETDSTINWLGVAMLQSDNLSVFGSTKKVKDFASQINSKIRLFL